MRFNKKIPAVIASASLAGLFAIGGIAAYFTDADTTTNTFTIGKVSLDLQEPSWNPDNADNLTPNQLIVKDPQIKNDGINTEFVFIEVAVPYENLITVNEAGEKNPAADTELFTYTINSGWNEIGVTKDTSAKTVLHRYVYGTSSKCSPLSAGMTTEKLFDSVTVANIVEDQNIEKTSQDIVINAYGIQSNDIGASDTDSPLEVWAVINNQKPVTDKAAEDTNTDIAK